MKTYHKPAEMIDYTNLSTAIVSGAVVVMGDLVGIAMVDIAQNATGPVLVQGIAKVTKVGSQAWTQGQTVFWNASGPYFTTTATAASRAGCAALAVGSGSGETTGYVMLNAAAGADIGTIGSHIADPASAAAVTQDALTDNSGGAAGTTLATPKLTGTLTGTANGALVDVAAAAGNCAGSAEPSATQVDTAIATAVASIVTGVNEQNAEFQAALVVVANAIASLAAQLAKVKTDIAAVRTGSEANNTAIDSILVALENFKVVAAS